MLKIIHLGHAIKGEAAYQQSKERAMNSTAAAKPIGNIKPDNEKQVFFYEQDFYVLSNFSAFTLVWPVGTFSARRFNTSEEAYHWEKFNHLGGVGVQQLLEEATSAHEAFQIAQKHKDLRRADWDLVKFDVMRSILAAKCKQHEYVRRKLLATGDRMLIEDSWRDDVWGWGPNCDGQNMLGKLWMEVRRDLRVAATGGVDNAR